MSSLLAAAALTASSLLPVPTLPPLLPGSPSPAQEQAEMQPEVQLSGALDAPDGRLKRGCKDYRYAYSVSAPTDDWTFDISMRDRHGKGVNSQSLLGPNDPSSGILTYRLCRWATVPGRFTLTGALRAYDYGEETSTSVTETFRLRRRNR
jgi:hypothetical protein